MTPQWSAVVQPLQPLNGRYVQVKTQYAAVQFSNIAATPNTLAGYGIIDAEHALGNPAVDGYLLSSTTAGVRSWVPPPTAGGGTGTRL